MLLLQDQLLKVLLSYLRLLVNSRDELALSQAINIPYRELAHKQFTALRKVAREKNMPMFQVSTSYVLASWHALIQDLKLGIQNFQRIWLIKAK